MRVKFWWRPKHWHFLRLSRVKRTVLPDHRWALSIGPIEIRWGWQ